MCVPVCIGNPCSCRESVNQAVGGGVPLVRTEVAGKTSSNLIFRWF